MILSGATTIGKGLILSLALLYLSGCSSLPKDYHREASYVLEDTANTRFARSVAPDLKKHPDKTGIYLLASGMDAFVARVGLIDGAQRSLDIQYYIWHADTTGRMLIQHVINAADRGVRVRLLLDDFDTTGKDSKLTVLNEHPNIEIRLYNPFTSRQLRGMQIVTDLSRLNRRMHNKSITADNAMTIVGGRNIGNEYFGAVSHAEFADLDAMCIGPIVNDVSRMFDKYWNSKFTVPVSAYLNNKKITDDELKSVTDSFDKAIYKDRKNPYFKAIQDTPILNKIQTKNLKFYWGEADLLYDDPGKVEAKLVTSETHLAPNLSKYIEKTTQEITIVSPYFVPNDELVDYLGSQVKRGVHVRVLTNSLAANDVSIVHAGYMRYRTDLLRKGIELYEFKALDKNDSKRGKSWSGTSRASLHAKTFLLDRKVSFVGSFNLDPRSVELNTEMGVLFKSEKLVGLMAESIDELLVNEAYRLELTTTSADESDSGFEEYDLQWISNENGKTVRYSHEPDTSWWQRFSTGVLSIFVIESFL